MVFVRPMALWMLLLVLPLVAMHLSRRLGLGPLRTVTVTALRTLAFILLVLAVARPVTERNDPTRSAVVVLDLSSSMTDTDLDAARASLQKLITHRAAHEVVRLVTFGRTARQTRMPADLDRPGVLASLRDNARTAVPSTQPAQPGSVLADALELAGALIPHDGGGRVIVYTDGLETGGDARAAALRLANRGIRVMAEPVGASRSNEVVLRSVFMPAAAGIGATVELQAEIESAGATDAKLIVRREDDATGSGASGPDEITTPVTLRAGRQIVSCHCPLHREGLSRYTVRVDAPADTLADNNTLPAAVQVKPPQNVLVLEDNPARPATAALNALLGEAARVAPADLADDRKAAAVLASADLLVIADTAAEAIGAGVQRRIRDAVVSGMGLLVTGGRRSFGPGGYANTPLADVLPVKFSQKVERRDPSATLVVIIDTSGSMGGPRVSLAKEVARLAIARLKPHDKVGIVEFYGSKRWAAPIQPASNAIDLQRALNRLSASGGTIILPAIEEAYYALQNVRTRTKHVLVLTDGGVEPGAFEPLIRKMSDASITVSTVMVGPGTDSAFLANLAQWGRGKFYSAPDRFNLPEVIVKQTESSLLTPFVEQPSVLVRKKDDPTVAGIDFAKAPRLSGYVETEARPTAEVILESDLGHPVLARWRYGLGRVAAFTAQAGGEWSSDLVQWSPYGRLFSNLARSLGAPGADGALRVMLVLRPGAIELQVDNRIANAADALSPLELTVTDANGAARARIVDPIQPDEWNVRLADPAAGTYRVDARTADGKLRGSGAMVVPPVREVTSLGPDRGLTDDINAMKDRAARQAAALSTNLATRPREFWPALVAAAMVLILLNVLVRRWPARAPRLTGTHAAIAAMVLLLAGIPRGATAAPASADSRPPGATRATTNETSPASQPLGQDVLDAIEHALRAENSAERDKHFAEACRLTLMREGSPDALIGHLQRSRSEPGVAFLLAEAARVQGNLELARRTLTELAAAPNAGADVWSELARVEEMLGNDPAAIAACERAIAMEGDPQRLFALRIRRALILYDGTDKAAADRALLEAIAVAPSGDTTAARFCGHLAALNGGNDLAVRLLVPSDTPKAQFHTHLSRGLLLLHLDRPDEAEQEFEQAYRKAPLSRDRRFALERVISSARQAGHLKALADRWLADPQLAADRLGALVAILRELGRADDALRMLQRPPQTPEQRELMASPEFHRELIAVAVEAGRGSDAEAAYRALLEKEPAQIEWRIGLARLLLLDGKRDEAAKLFGDAADRFDDVANLMALANGARQLALDEVALAAAKKAGAKGGGAKVRAVLFEADMLRQRGQTDKAIALLRQLLTLAEQDIKVLQPVAETFERYGDKAEALRLFKRLYEKTRGEDVLLKVAWLLEEDRQFEEACALWKNMWETTQVAARLRQAQERMLDLAARTGKLADLAIEMEERIAEGRAEARHLSLLVDIYTQANDPISAAEILQAYGRKSGNQIEMLKRLAKVYLNCEQFGRCNSTLRRLVALDPENALDYLEQIAIVALERRQPQQAKAALAELAAVAGNDEVVDEFSAGVLDMTGLHEEAAASYGRVLAKHPDRIEAFLLWGRALKEAGQGERAIARFEDLLEEAAEDDLFTVAVDGLLNLGAKPAALRSALRRVYTRIAAKPDKVFLYQLAGDLLEALGRTAEMTEVMEQAVVVAGERRGPMLRELMDSAKAEGKNDQVIQFGQSLLGLGEELPPQVFLDLGEAMFKEGELAQAERVFERAALESDYTAIRQRVATYYEEANMPAVADRIIRELLGAQPDNTPLLIRSGALCEQLGHFDRAFEQYDHAADLMLRRLPGAIRGDEPDRKKTRDDASKRPERFGRAANLDEMAQFFRSATNGLRSAARTPALRERLLQVVSARVEEELNSLVAGRTLMPTIDKNPRLDQLAGFLRDVAFSLHVPDAADRIDQKLMERYPKDTKLRTAAVQSRLDWGLTPRAAALAGNAPAGWTVPTRLAADTLLSDKARLQNAIAKGAIDVAVGKRLVPMLIIAGREDEARRALRAIPTKFSPTAGADISATDSSLTYYRGADRPAVGFIEGASTMIVSAVALDDRETLRAWMNAWIETCSKMRDANLTVTNLQRCLSLVWNHLSTEERAAIVDRFAKLADGMEGDQRLKMDLLRRRLADQTGMPFDGMDRILQNAPQDRRIGIDVLAELFEKVSADARPGLLTQIVNAREPLQKRTVLLSLAASLEAPADEGLIGTFESLLKAAPKPRRDDSDEGSSPAGNWHSNRNQPELGRRIAEVLLSESPNDPAVLAAAAAARENAGAHDEAMPLVKEAIDAILEVKKPTYMQFRLAGELARLMRPEDTRAVIADLDERQQIEGPSATRWLVKAILLDAIDQKTEAIAAYRTAFEMQPSDRPFISRLILALKQGGRTVELARLLSSRLTKSTIMETYEWYTLVTLYGDLFDPLKAMRAAQKLETVQAPVEMMRIARMMGQTDEVRTIFRRLCTNNRDSGRFYTPVWPLPPAPGGMVGYSTKQQAWGRERTFSALADLPFAEGEFEALLLAAPPDQRDVSGLIEGLVKATRLNNTRAALVDSLVDACRRKAFTAKDQRMLVSLAEENPANITDALAPALDEVLANTSPEDALTLITLARAYRARGSVERARPILRWMAISLPRGGRIVGFSGGRLDYLEDYLSVIPEAQRSEERRKLLGYLEPTPLDPPSDEFDAAWLECLAAASDPSELNRRVETLRKRLESGASTATPLTLAAAIARLDAAAGRIDSFKAVVARVCADVRDDGFNVQPFDSRTMLPPAARLNDPARYVDVIASAFEARRAEGTMSKPTITRQICLMGDYCVENGLPDKAKALLQSAQGHMGSPGEHWLWVADLAKRAGLPAKGVEIETKLLDADMLPVLRVPKLLDAIESAQGQESADKLAIRVAGYSDHPEVLKRAIRHAKTVGDTAAAAKYLDRLRKTSPAGGTLEGKAPSSSPSTRPTTRP